MCEIYLRKGVKNQDLMLNSINSDYILVMTTTQFTKLIELFI